VARAGRSLRVVHALLFFNGRRLSGWDTDTPLLVWSAAKRPGLETSPLRLQHHARTTYPPLDSPTQPHHNAGVTTRTLKVLKLGRRPYREVWELQRSVQHALMRGEGEDTLVLCEHAPVITIGRSAKAGNLIASPEHLAKLGIEAIEIERGGDITYHGPGQLVAYPLLDLNYHRRDVGWYLRTLEDVVIDTLQTSGITGLRYPGRTGVWTQVPENAINFGILDEPGRLPVGGRAKKIASIGVRLSRWCTLHGLALNVLECRSGFQCINPCGFTDIDVTSMAEERPSGRFEVAAVAEVLRDRFKDRFSFTTYVEEVRDGEE
jgi:lipoyl(octanoyl) transferase